MRKGDIFMTTDEKLDLLITRFNNLENEVSSLKGDMTSLKGKVTTLEETVRNNTIVIENTVNQAMKALSEGYHLNAERIAKFDIEQVKTNSDIALSISRLAIERIDLLERKMKQSA